MTGDREFLELPDLDGALDSLEPYADLAAKDMGAVRATFRPWPGTTFWVVLVIVAVGGAAACLAAPDGSTRVVAFAILASLLLFLVAFVVAGALDRIRVCEHGLVVGLKTDSRYVIPWSTLDPGRVRVIHRVGLVGRLPGRDPSSPHYRLGIFTTRALAVNGLDTARGGWWAVPGMLGVADAVTPGSRVRSSPFVWWLLGTRRPADLARAIEGAMVADGYRATGLADRAVAQAHTMQLNPGTHDPLPVRAATDPALGLP